MFANLVENALTHTPKGTRIEIAVTSRNFGRIEVLVSDNGPGVPADEREKIFHRFHRLEASRTTPGTGLGLALVAAIAKLHGGSIAAEDNSPGLRVRVVFPAVDAKGVAHL
jgi:signal transduction histidine kinase